MSAQQEIKNADDLEKFIYRMMREKIEEIKRVGGEFYIREAEIPYNTVCGPKMDLNHYVIAAYKGMKHWLPELKGLAREREPTYQYCWTFILPREEEDDF